MQAGQGQIQEQARYMQLFDRAGKDVEQLGACLLTCEEKLRAVLEKASPSPKGSEDALKELPPVCDLEDVLLNLCNGIELRLSKLAEINQRIRL